MAMTHRAGPMRAGRRAAVAALAVGLVLLASTATLAATAWKARAWFDAPLPGATLPLAPYLIVVHAADDSGVARVRFLVDGVPAGTQDAGGGGDLVTINWVWEPTTLGQHLLTAVAEGNDGSLSDPASVGVTVSADAEVQPTPDISPSPSQSAGGSATPRPSGATPGPSPTLRPTAAPTPTPTPIPTPVPTPVPCTPTGPQLVAPAPGEAITVNPPTLEWSNADLECPPELYRIVVDDDPGLGAPWVFAVDVANDTLFYTLPDPLDGTPDCVYYYWTVYAVDRDGNTHLSAIDNFLVCTRA